MQLVQERGPSMRWTAEAIFCMPHSQECSTAGLVEHPVYVGRNSSCRGRRVLIRQRKSAERRSRQPADMRPQAEWSIDACLPLISHNCIRGTYPRIQNKCYRAPRIPMDLPLGMGNSHSFGRRSNSSRIYKTNTLFSGSVLLLSAVYSPLAVPSSHQHTPPLAPEALSSTPAPS